MSGYEVFSGPPFGPNANKKALVIYKTFTNECVDIVKDNKDITRLELHGDCPMGKDQIDRISQCGSIITDLALIGPNQVDVGVLDACRNITSLMIKNSGINMAELKWARYTSIKTLRLEGVNGLTGDMRGSMIEKMFISHIRCDVIEIVDANNLQLLNLKNLVGVTRINISGPTILRVLAIQDAKSLSDVEISVPIETLSIMRTSKKVAKALAKTCPNRLEIEGRFEYKNEVEAKVDYPNALISMS